MDLVLFQRAIANSFVADSFPNDSDRIRERLYKETEKQGLRNTDLAELSGWSASKTSKITAGKQKLTADDIKMWARCLGYSPDPFVSENMDLRYYQLGTYVRHASECFEHYFDADDDYSELSAIINYEVPLAILSQLGVTVSDYAVRTNVSRQEYDPVIQKYVGSKPTYIRFWHRTTHDPEKMTPQFGIWFSPENEKFLVAVYLDRSSGDGAMPQIRSTYKDALQIEQADTDEFDTFARANASWIPRKVSDGEIFSLGTTTNFFPDAGTFQNLLVAMFKKYCALVWEVKGVDLLPPQYKEPLEGELTTMQQFNIINGTAVFDPNVQEEARAREDFQCENNSQHKSFTDPRGRQYVDVVPLIPFTSAFGSGNAIMSAVNAVCLCPNCAAQLREGLKLDRERMVVNLYMKHREEMEKQGLNVSLVDILIAHGLK